MTDRDLRLEHRLIWMRVLARWAFWVAALLTTIVFFYLGPRVEAALSPVVEHFEITQINPVDEDRTEISGILFKPRARAHCQFVSLSITTTNYRDPDKIVQVDFEPNNRLVTRPPGSQEFGPWTLYRPEPPIGPLIIFHVQHRCHPLWAVDTELYVGFTRDFFPSNPADIEALEQDQ